MTQQFARVPTDAGAVVREVRGFGGVPWGRLFRYLRPNLWRFALAMVGLVFSSLIGLAFPLVIAGITTEVVAGGDSAGLDRLVVLLFGLFCVQAVGSFLQTYLLGIVGERVVAQLRGDLFGRLVTLSLDFHAGRRVGELVSRLSSDVTLVRTMLTQTVTSLLSSLIGLIGSVIILFTLSPTLLIIVLLSRACSDRGRVRVWAAAPAREHRRPGHDRAEHDHGRGGAVGHPRRQELRPRGLGARALRQRPAKRRGDRVAAGALACHVRCAHGPARVRHAGGSALVHR